jgi:hypothetical protein
MVTVPVFESALMGRVLPRGQRWVDVADEPVREDPGYERAAYLEWVRGEASLDFEDQLVEVLPDEWVGIDEVQPEPDVLVWVNGVPLEVWLAIAPVNDLFPDLEMAQLVLLPPPVEVPRYSVDVDLLVLLEDEAVEYGALDSGEAPGDNHADRRDAHEAWLLRRLHDDLGWGNTSRGRRPDSRVRYRRRSWERSANVKAATRAMRAARQVELVLCAEQEQPEMWIEEDEYRRWEQLLRVLDCWMRPQRTYVYSGAWRETR